MKLRIPRYRSDRKDFIRSVERDVLQRAEAAGDEEVLIQTAVLRRLIDIAKPFVKRSKGGRPSITQRERNELVAAACEEEDAIKQAHGKVTGSQKHKIIAGLA